MPAAARARVWARACAAAALLAAVVGGVPAVLARAAAGLGVSLVPSAVPTWDQVRHAATAPDTSMRGVLVVLFTLMWGLWAAFTASAVREAAVAVRSRGRRAAPPLPRLDALARPAAQLVAVVALAFTSAATAPTTAASPASSVVAAAPPSATLVPAMASVVRAATQVVHGADGAAPAGHAGLARYRVRRRDTLWGIAEHRLGDPMRWRELVALNPGGVGPAPDFLIREGTTLLLPAHDSAGYGRESRQVMVRAGDTLSQLADDHGTTWRAVWPVNAGRAEPGRDHLVDPDHIEPGWTVDLSPAPASEAGERHTGARAPAHPALGQVRTPRSAGVTAAPAPLHPAPLPRHTGRLPNGNEPDEPPAGPPAPSRVDTAPQPPAGAQDPDRPPAQLPVGAFAGGGAALAGVLSLALVRSRRRQFRSRRPGRVIAEPAPRLAGVERQVAAAGTSAAVDVTWLDQALRSLAQALGAEEGATSPDVLAARMTDHVLELVLTAPAPSAPSPWTVNESGTRWSVRRGDPLPYDPHARGYSFAPYPTLASVGFAADGERWLVDLERVGALALTGDRDACLGLARFMAVELVLNPWSEMLRVTLVGFGEEMAQANPDRLAYAGSAAEVLAGLSAQFREVDEASRRGGVDVLAGRLHPAAGDTWAPHVVLIAPDADVDPGELTRLLTAMRQQRSRTAVAVVLADHLAGSGDVRWQVSIDADRLLRIGPLGLEITAQHLSAGEAAPVAQLAAAVASDQDQPATPGRGDAPWERYADVCGNLRPDTAEDRPTRPEPKGESQPPSLHLADAAADDPGPGSSVLPMGEPTYLGRSATTAADLRALAPRVGDEVRRRVEDADGNLDADLADWADPDCTRPRVSLLGPVTVRAQGELPARNPRLAWNTELVAYLATHPRGVSTERLGTDLWPGDPDIARKTVLRQAVLVARRWLGSNPLTGRDHLPARRSPGTEPYRIEDVLVDAELFRRLRLRGVARGADGIGDLQAALDLVTGPPLDPGARRPEGYGWLSETHLDHEYAAMVVDVAHVVATHHLAAAEPAAAAAAARVALLAGSLEDVPLLDLVAACDALGDRAEADAYVQRILDNHDAEVEEDLPPRTAEVLFRRQWLPQAGQRAKTG